MEQGRIMEAEAPTVQVGATLTGLMAPPLPQPLQGFLQAGCPSCRPTNSVKALKAIQVYALGSISRAAICLRLYASSLC